MTEFQRKTSPSINKHVRAVPTPRLGSWHSHVEALLSPAPTFGETLQSWVELLQNVCRDVQGTSTMALTQRVTTNTNTEVMMIERPGLTYFKSTNLETSSLPSMESVIHSLFIDDSFCAVPILSRGSLSSLGSVVTVSSVASPPILQQQRNTTDINGGCKFIVSLQLVLIGLCYYSMLKLPPRDPPVFCVQLQQVLCLGSSACLRR